MAKFNITPAVGIIHVYIDGILYSSKRHQSRYGRECYCHGIIRCYNDSVIRFVFNDGIKEIEMGIYDPKAPIEKIIHPVPSFFKDGIEYFDADKFCKWYIIPEAIPNKLHLETAKLSLK